MLNSQVIQDLEWWEVASREYRLPGFSRMGYESLFKLICREL